MAIRPARGNISSAFNPARKHPITGRVQPHNGEDVGWGSGGGTRIYAPISGTVTYGTAGGYGNRLVLRSGNVEIWLCHLASAIVKSGRVTEGQHIATMGMTGTATGVHLHWEVRVGGVLQNPAVWLSSQTKPASSGGAARFDQDHANRQAYLNQHFGAGLIEDGIPGPASEKAIAAYQRNHLGLTDDGKWGPRTQAAHQARHDRLYPAAKPVAQITVDGDWGDATTRSLQTALGVTVDGDFGHRTIEALQERIGGGLRVDGDFGLKSKRRLQEYLGVRVDGDFGDKSVRALQTRLNAGRF